MQLEPPEPSLARRFFPRWLSWIAGAMVLLVLAHTGWTLYWKHRFDSRIEELRAAGVPVEITELATPPIPDAENANVLLMEADAWYEAHLLDGEDRLTYAKYEEADDERQVLRKWLASGDHYVALLMKASARRLFREELDWDAGWGMSMFSIPRFSRANSFLNARVKYAVRASSATLAELTLILKLARHRAGAVLIDLFVRQAGDRTAADVIESYAAVAEFDAVAAWAQLGALLRTNETTAQCRRAMQGERAMALWVTRRMLGGQGHLSLIPLTSINPDELPEPTTVFNWPYRALLYQDALRAMDTFDRADEQLNLLPHVASAAAKDGYSAIALTRFSVVSSLYASIPRRVFDDRVKHVAAMRVARVGLALHVERQRSGSWPESLDTVVAMVGEDDILDPFTGKRLKYVPGVVLEAAGAVTEEDMREFDEIAWHFAVAGETR
jgi:hypothetical protein